jgi:hypothetical protein
MTSSPLWTLITIQIAMGAFDTFYRHEMTERLAWRPTQRHELQLHGVRNMLYALLFLTLGWLEVHGIWAMIVIAVLVAEVVITLMDFVEEDISRKLPASERINHTLLALNYGAILVLLLPVLIEWAGQSTAVTTAFYGFWGVLAAVSAAGVSLFGLRDLAASKRLARLNGVAATNLVQADRATDDPGHGCNRLYRQPACFGPHQCRTPGHRAGPKSSQGGCSASTGHIDPRSVTQRSENRCDRKFGR